MPKTRAHTGGKTFAIVVACSAVVTFLVIYWGIQTDDLQESGRLEKRLPQPSVSAGDTSFQLPPKPASEPGVAELSSVPATREVAANSELATSSDGPGPVVPPPPQSLTFNAALSVKSNHPSSTEVSSGADEASDLTAKEIDRTESIDVHSDSGGCKSCSNSQVGSIGIPRSCTYVSHTITQLQREPFAPIEEFDDRTTKFSASPDADNSGRIGSVRLYVGVRKTAKVSSEASITMRLSVAMACQRVGG